MVEGRLMRAVACCGARRAGELRISPLLAEIGEAAARALAEFEATTSPDVIPRFQPLPADETDFLTAMSWFAALYPPEARPPRWQKLDGMARFNRPQKVVLWRARNVPPSFDEIGIMLFGVDCKKGRREEIDRRVHAAGSRARYSWKAALEACWRTANGMAPRSKRVQSRRPVSSARLTGAFRAPNCEA
jgi:hypothetical protein